MLGGFSIILVWKSFIVNFTYVSMPFSVGEHGGSVHTKWFQVDNSGRQCIMVCHYLCMVNICMYFEESMRQHVHRFLYYPCYVCQLCKFQQRTPINHVHIYMFTCVQLQIMRIHRLSQKIITSTVVNQAWYHGKQWLSQHIFNYCPNTHMHKGIKT